MKQISIDNGAHFLEPEEAIKAMQERGEEDGVLFSDLWQVVADMMDDDTRETVHSELAPCTELEFLTRYLELADDDLIV